MDRPPFFAFYPADFANDIKVESMSTLQVGAYILLLCKAWQSDPPATLPSDDVVLARLARVELTVWTEIKSVVLDAFRIGADGRLMNKRLRAEFDKASRLIRDKKKNAQKAAESRWGRSKGNADALPEQCRGNAIQSQMQRDSVPSELSGESPPGLAAEPGGGPPKKPARKPPAGPHHATIAEFCSRWEQKYGAKYPFNAGKDAAAVKWMLAQADGNPDRLAAVFDRYFGDEDPFFAAGDRHSIGKLRQHFARWLVEAPIPNGLRTKDRVEAEAQQFAEYAQDAFGGPN